MSSSYKKLEAQNRAVDNGELLQIALAQSFSRVSPDYHGRYESAKKFVTQRTLGETVFDKDNGLLVGTVQCRLWMNDEGTEGADQKVEADEAFRDALCAIEANYAVVFTLTGDHSEDIAVGFFDRLAPFAAWAYFRGHVGHVAAEAGISIPPLPVKRLSYPVKSKTGFEELPSPEPAPSPAKRRKIAKK